METQLIIPWENVVDLAEHRVEVNIPDIAPFEREPAEDAILLKDYVMDKKVLDLEESEVEVVYDIRLAFRNKKLYVTDVDTGKSARLRRFGLGLLSKVVTKDTDKDQMISWTYIQPLPTNIGSFKGDVKLTVLKENLAEIHPVDLADILEELDHDQRVAVFTRSKANMHLIL